ncbi:MAG: ATP synthase F1 subunit delta [Clostridia bacterium]|nr:ATP synthase F1 subunit delta [Clostridia bacterium]
MRRLSDEYAKALYEIAAEASHEEIISSQLKDISGVIAENPEYIKLLDNPSIDKSERVALAREAFAGANEYLLNFLLLLTEARGMSELPDCAARFCELYDEAHDIVRAELISAVNIDEKRQESIKQKLEAKTGKKVVLTQKTDPALLGGALLRYSGRQIDMSVRSSLNKLSEIISKSDV